MLLDLCNGIVKEGCIPEDWKSSVILPIYKGKGDPTECGSYWGLNCWNMVSKCWKGSLSTEFSSRLREMICSLDL